MQELGPAGWQSQHLCPWKIKEGPRNIKQQVRKDFKMTRNYRSFINSSCIKYNKLCQSYSQINTGGHTKTPFGSVDRPDGLVHQQHQTGWKAGPVFEQLGTDHTRDPGHIRVPNRAKLDPMASKAHARDKMLPGGVRENLTGGSRTYGQGCYSGDNTVQKQFCVPNLSCGKEGKGTEASNKPQEPQHLCTF